MYVSVCCWEFTSGLGWSDCLQVLFLICLGVRGCNMRSTDRYMCHLCD
jgi:hypothetical protein